MKNARLIFFAMSLILASDSIAISSDDVDLVRDGHAQAREAIRTLSLKVESIVHFRKDPSRQPIRGAGSWWQDGANYRSSEEDLVPYGANQTITPIRHDLLFLDGRAKVLHEEGPPGNTSQVRGWIGEPSMLGAASTPWHWGLFQLTSNDQLKILDALRDAPKYVERVERETQNGESLFRVEFKPIGQVRFSAWIDPSVNYFARRMVLDVPQAQNRTEGEVQEFREGRPGIFFPVRVLFRDFHKGELMSERTYTVTELRINEPIDRSKFTLAFPKGAYVEDHARGVKYVAGLDEEPHPEVPVRTLTPEKTQQVQYPTGQVLEKPFSWQRTAAWVGIGLVSMSAVAWFFLSRRNRQPSGEALP